MKAGLICTMIMGTVLSCSAGEIAEITIGTDVCSSQQSGLTKATKSRNTATQKDTAETVSGGDGSQLKTLPEYIELEAQLTNKNFFIVGGKKVSRNSMYNSMLKNARASVEIKTQESEYQVEESNFDGEYMKSRTEAKTKNCQDTLHINITNLDTNKSYLFSVTCTQWLKDKETKEIKKADPINYGPVKLTESKECNLAIFSSPYKQSETFKRGKTYEYDNENNLKSKSFSNRTKAGYDSFAWEITVRLNGAIIYKLERGNPEEYYFVKH